MLFEVKMNRKKNEGVQTIVYFSERPTLSSNGLYVIFAGIAHPSPEYYIIRTERSGIFWGGVYVFEYVLSGKGYIEFDGMQISSRSSHKENAKFPMLITPFAILTLPRLSHTSNADSPISFTLDGILTLMMLTQL